MTSPLDELRGHAIARGCGARDIADVMTPEYAEAWRVAVDGDPNVFPAAHLAKIAKTWGYQVGASTISKHRRGECACG